MSRIPEVERPLRSGEDDWLAIEAWRGRSGHALVYFLQTGPDGSLSDDDRLDRRALLEPGVSVQGLDEDTLGVLLEGAAPLTVTERRLQGPDGEPWLARNEGPVWAAGDSAAGVTSIEYIRLGSPPMRLRAAGEHVGSVSTRALEESLAGAVVARGTDDAAAG